MAKEKLPQDIAQYACPTCKKVDKVLYIGRNAYRCSRCNRTFKVEETS